MSIKLSPGQQTVVYPPRPGEGICSEPCAHYDCYAARRDAQRLCPECGQPLGFGALLPIVSASKVSESFRGAATGATIWSSSGQPLLVHLDCYEAAMAAARVSVTLSRNSVTISVDETDDDFEDNPDA